MLNQMKRPHFDLVDDEVEFDNNNDEDTLFESDVTESDREFVDDDDEDMDDGSFHRAFDQQNPVCDESAMIYPLNNYRQTLTLLQNSQSQKLNSIKTSLN